MAETRRDIQYTSLDFDDIKESLIDFIKKYKIFNGANFEGSGLNLLSDLLAYVTHMTAVTANMSANEMFMDSAQLRQSIVSKAKELGYCPISIRTPRAKIRVTFYDTSEARENVKIEEGTKFGTKFETVFCTRDDVLALPTGKYKLEENRSGKITSFREFSADVDIYEGYLHEFTYEVDLENEDQRFYIPDTNADISTLTVTIQPFDTSSLVVYNENDNINLLTPKSEVYFLHQNPDSMYEVTFGDGVLGKKLNHGDKVILKYIVCNKGPAMNGCDYFTKGEPIEDFTSYDIETLEAAKDGYEQESGDSIRNRASKMWKAQNRAVVKEDYKAILLGEYPWIDSVSVWGGQYNDPPTYGKVFFAIKPKHTDLLSFQLKEKIKNDMIKKYNVLTMIPEIVDPEYIYVGVETVVQYDKGSTLRSENDIETDIRNNIIKYFKDTVEDFDMTLYHSPIVSIIDKSDICIVASKTKYFLSKLIYPKENVEERFIKSFSNPIVPGTLKSCYFNSGNDSVYVSSYMADNGNGSISIYSSTEGNNEPLMPNIGHVNYETGEFEVIITPYALPPFGAIRIYADPVNENIEQQSREIILKDTSVENARWGVRHGTQITMVPVALTRK